ncbi:hypothetical protein D621_02750 [beta proteobacterium AAP51]|nr:hypothetical protein D621_02750 [beta proteobacterium AAP51]
MLPQVPLVLECVVCQKPFWRNGAEVVAEVRAWSDVALPLGCRDAPYLIEPGEEGYLGALERLIAEHPDEERLLRLHAWWKGNDHHRSPSTKHQLAGESTSARRESNMEALMRQIEPGTPDSTLMRAELLRELGRFDDALQLLEAALPAGLDLARKRIRALCEARDRVVRPLG